MTLYSKRQQKLARVLTQKPQFTQELFERLWKQKLKVGEIAAFFGVSTDTVTNAAKKLELQPKRVIKNELSLEWQPGDPTAEEIAARAAEVRKGWSEAEKAKRMGCVPATARVEIKAYNYDVCTMSFSGAENATIA